MTDEQKRALFARQKRLLDTFLGTHAITRAQYDKSLGDLAAKMGISGEAERTAYFAGGCFWCITPSFALTDGVKRVECGYSGGTEPAPTYEEVKAQQTGHRETVAVTYDPAAVSYVDLFDVFLASVDPFDAGGQYVDRGRSYTLAAYVTSPEEKTIVREKLAALEETSGRTPAVAVEPFAFFVPAEEEHQEYYLKNPEAFENELRESGRQEKNHA